MYYPDLECIDLYQDGRHIIRATECAPLFSSNSSVLSVCLTEPVCSRNTHLSWLQLVVVTKQYKQPKRPVPVLLTYVSSPPWRLCTRVNPCFSLPRKYKMIQHWLATTTPQRLEKTTTTTIREWAQTSNSTTPTQNIIDGSDSKDTRVSSPPPQAPVVLEQIKPSTTFMISDCKLQSGEK